MTGACMSQNILLKVKLFSAFAHPVRLRILEELKKKEMCVSELVGSIKNVSQSQVSNHLICLRDCGLVSSRREWRRVYYRLADPKVGELLEVADELLPKVSERVGKCVDIEKGRRVDV